MKEPHDRTHYELLGLEPGVSTEEIKEAYREIARIYHPDSNFYDDIIEDAGPEDSDVFKSITAAYQVLINEEKRRLYDETLPKGLSSWGDDEDEGGVTFAEAEPIVAGPVAGDEIPEEWRAEREYFEEHFEEILKPAPKVNLISAGNGVPGAPQVEGTGDPFTGWEESQKPPVQPRFGNADEIKEPVELEVVLPGRRAIASFAPSMDPISLIIYVGMPLMFVIVLAELFYLRS